MASARPLLEVDEDLLAPGVLRLAARGEIDLSTALEFREPVRRALIDQTLTTVVVDLTAVEFMDSTGLAALTGAKHDLGDRGRLVVVCTQPHLLRLFEVTGLDRYLEIVPAFEPDTAAAPD